MSAEHPQRFELITLTSDAELAKVVAIAWLDSVRASNERGAPQCVAISGGRIARKFFEAIAVESKCRAISLASVHFFWADERCVPPDHPESNFALANRFLFQPLSIPTDRIHRIAGEESPEQAAAMATAEICRVVPTSQSGCPILDLVFLGMGEDGHVASLFPDMPMALQDTKEAYISVVAPKPPMRRVSLSYNALRAAREVWVLASGPGKEGSLASSLADNGTTPLARVLQMRKNTRLFTDVPGSGRRKL